MKNKPKIIEQIGNYILIFLVTSMIISLFLLFKNGNEKERSFKNNAKPFEICALLKRKTLIENESLDGRATPSQPKVSFSTDNLRCNYFPQKKEWVILKVGQSYLIKGKYIPTFCKVERVLGACDLNMQKAYPKL